MQHVFPSRPAVFAFWIKYYTIPSAFLKLHHRSGGGYSDYGGLETFYYIVRSVCRPFTMGELNEVKPNRG